MKAPAKPAAVCSTCHGKLSDKGFCLTCLLRGGLEQTSAPTDQASPSYGDYEIVRREDGSLWELGHGAMGVTYRAVDRALHRPAALKVIRMAGGTGDIESMRALFLGEARAAGALRHTNVAGVYQLGVSPENGGCYYAMELVEGETLEARVCREGPLEVGAALEAVRQVAAALVAAADRGLIHRDLKPSNLMLVGDGERSAEALEVKVIDFGLAKAAAAIEEEDFPSHEGFVGTPAFASPEQFDRSAVDARSDLYSLGLVFWYALTGLVPFAGRSLDELHHHPARAHLPVEQLAARGVAPCVAGLLRRLLAVDPAQRPDSARMLLKELEQCRQQLGAAGARPMRRRRPLAWVTTSLGLLATVVGLTVWQRTGGEGSQPMAALPGTLASPPLAPAPEKSVAVLPFDSLSEDKNSALFADGVQDEVLTDLAKVADLKVISRSSVMQYKDARGRNLRRIGDSLGVAYIVEGSVQHAGGRLRVTARLIDARTDAHRWAEKYDRPPGDVFAIQSEIAQTIAAQLQAAISPQEHAAMAEMPTRDETAYELYLRARSLWDAYDNVSDIGALCDSVLDLLRQAIARDPDFTRAFRLMTWVQGTRYRNAEHTPPNAEAARDLAEAVARRRPGSADAHMAMGYYHYLVTCEFARARDEFAAVVQRVPNDAWAHRALAMALRRQGRLEEALAALRPALALDPEGKGDFVFYLEVLDGLRRYAEAAAAIDRRLASHPQWNHLWIWRAFLVSLGSRADARAALVDLAHLPAGFDPEGAATYYRLEFDAMARDFDLMARDLAANPLDTIYNVPRELFAGDLARYRGDAAAAAAAYTAARQRLAAMVHHQPTKADLLFYLALADASLGQRDKALEEGQRALANVPADDARDRPEAMAKWAKLLMRLGEREQAIVVLQALGRQPYGLEYGRLRLEPDWDPLRGDPRFEALIVSLAP